MNESRYFDEDVDVRLSAEGLALAYEVSCGDKPTAAEKRQAARAFGLLLLVFVVTAVVSLLAVVYAPVKSY